MYMIVTIWLSKRNLMQSKLGTYIGFAIRSGKVVFGYDNLFKSKKKVILVLYSLDLAEKMQIKLKTFCNDQKIDILPLENPNLSDIIKRDNCKVLGICEPELSKVIAKEITQQN